MKTTSIMFAKEKQRCGGLCPTAGCSTQPGKEYLL